MSGTDALAVRASKKLRPDYLLTSLAGTILRIEMDKVPLWRGDHVPVSQLVEDFARYLYLPRLKDSNVLLEAIRDGLSLLTWRQDSFGFAESFDEEAGRYRGLRGGDLISMTDVHATGLLVKPDVTSKQLDAERVPLSGGSGDTGQPSSDDPEAHGSATGGTRAEPAPGAAKPKRFHGSVTLDTARVGRDASKIAEEVIAHLAGLVGAKVTVTLEISAEVPGGVPDQAVRTVTENSRTLKFTDQGFEKE